MRMAFRLLTRRPTTAALAKTATTKALRPTILLHHSHHHRDFSGGGGGYMKLPLSDLFLTTNPMQSSDAADIESLVEIKQELHQAQEDVAHLRHEAEAAHSSLRSWQLIEHKKQVELFVRLVGSDKLEMRAFYYGSHLRETMSFEATYDAAQLAAANFDPRLDVAAHMELLVEAAAAAAAVDAGVKEDGSLTLRIGRLADELLVMVSEQKRQKQLVSTLVLARSTRVALDGEGSLALTRSHVHLERQLDEMEHQLALLESKVDAGVGKHHAREVVRIVALLVFLFSVLGFMCLYSSHFHSHQRKLAAQKEKEKQQVVDQLQS